MKLPITVYGILAFALTTVVVCGCSNPSNSEKLQKHQVIDIKTVKVEKILGNKVVDATLENPTIVKVAFSVSGKLEKGELILEEGSLFKKGQLLYQINNREAFAALNRVKTELATKLVQLLPEIETQFPTEKNKWVRFMEELKPQYLVPALPQFKTSKERYLFTEKGCLTDYYRLQEMEVNMANYFFIAPFDGSVISITEQPENQIKTGKTIARIAKKESLRIKTKIWEKWLRDFQRPIVCNIQGDTIGNAIYKTSTHLSYDTPEKMLCRFDLELFRNRPVFHGMKVKLVSKTHEELRTTIPLSALNDESVQVFSNGKLTEKPIQIVERYQDVAIVKGLNSAEKIAVKFQLSVDPKTIYTAR